jgi:putative membrane protein
MWMNGGYGLLMMASMGLFTILAIAAVMVLVVWLARSTTSTPNRADPAEAETLLRRRYAAGEIDDEEYQRRLTVLRGQPPPPSR